MTSSTASFLSPSPSPLCLLLHDHLVIQKKRSEHHPHSFHANTIQAHTHTHTHTQEYKRLWEHVQLFMKCSSTYMRHVLNNTLRILTVIQSLLWANTYNMNGIQVSTSLVSIPQFHMKHHRTDCLSQEQKELLTPTPTFLILPNTLIIFLASCK